MKHRDIDLSWNFPDAISRQKRARIARMGAIFIAAQLLLFFLLLLL